MFLFNSNHGNDPISFPDHPFFHSSFPFHDEDLLFQQPEHDTLLHDHHQTQATFINMVDDSNNLNEQEIQRKKSLSNRDRHSKINTLRGPRDRRMRLSLPVAREFFGLQDMLGVDKASKTVEWLLYQARHEIKKLSRAQSFHDGATARSASSISDSEVMSGIDETVAVDNGNKRGGFRKVTTTKEKRSGSRPTRKTVFQPLARECREKARARARARTQEKQLQITRKLNHVESTKQDLGKISSSWSTHQIETGEESAGTAQIEDRQTQRIFDDHDHHQDNSLMIMRRWSPSNSIDQSLQNNNGIHQEHPFGDYQFLGKPWEAYNNHGIC